MFKHILLATDGSTASRHAATLAVGLARAHGAKLTAVYVVDPYPFLGMGEINPIAFGAYMAAAHGHAAQAHSDVSALCDAAGGPVDLQVRMVEDVAASSGILQTAKAEGADLIVLGTHGRSGLARLMPGGVTTKVMAGATVPVLVTR